MQIENGDVMGERPEFPIESRLKWDAWSDVTNFNFNRV
jgi:acyl-CoA-binding protein